MSKLVDLDLAFEVKADEDAIKQFSIEELERLINYFDYIIDKIDRVFAMRHECILEDMRKELNDELCSREEDYGE